MRSLPSTAGSAVTAGPGEPEQEIRQNGIPAIKMIPADQGQYGAVLEEIPESEAGLVCGKH